MNIGIVVRTLRIGGMERVAANLADAFQKEGHTVTLMYLKNKPVEILPENKNTDIRLIDLDRKLLMTGVGFLWLAFSRFMNMIIRKSFFVWNGFVLSKLFAGEIEKIENEKGRFDLLIVRGQGTFELIWNLKDTRVVQVCESIFKNEKKTFLGSLYAGLLFNNKNVVCVSHGVLETFNEFKKKNCIEPRSSKMITNPIDSENIKYRSVDKIDGLPKYKYILGLGRFVKHKNFPLLIHAFNHLIITYSIEQNLVLVGDGKEREELISLTKHLGLEKRILFPGLTDNPYAWMANADLFVLSSESEGLGMVILEAFASGTNVVSTNCPGGVKNIMMSETLSSQLAEMETETLANIIFQTMNTEFPASDIDVVLEKFLPETIVNEYIQLFI